MVKIKRKRSRFLIYPKFQLTLLLVNSGIIFSLIMIVRYKTQQYFSELHDVGIASNLDSTHPYFQLLTVQSETFYSMLTSAFSFGTCLSIVVTIFLSHRLAGPIVRLRGHFQSICDGRGYSENLKFRKMDFFSDLPPIVNQAVHKLQHGSKSKSSHKKAS